MDWIKLSCTILGHRKIKILRAMRDGDTLALMWFLLLAEAGKSNRAGYLMVTDGVPFTAEILSQVFDIKLRTVKAGLEAYERLGMIGRDDRGMFITNWSRYQAEDKLEQRRQQDRQRKAAHRERQRQMLLPASGVSHVTSQDPSRDVTDQRTDGEREGDKTTDSGELEQYALSELAAVKLGAPSSKTLRSCFKSHGASALVHAVGAAVVAAKKGQKINNIDGYITSLCKDFIPSADHVSWSDRKQREAEAKANQQHENQKAALKEKADEDLATARNDYWSSLTEEARAMWRGVSELNSSGFKNKDSIEITAKMIAFEDHERETHFPTTVNSNDEH